MFSNCEILEILLFSICEIPSFQFEKFKKFPIWKNPIIFNLENLKNVQYKKLSYIVFV